METKTCTKCKETKPTSEFSKNKKGFVSECKPCRVKMTLDYRERNRDKVNEYRRQWRKTTNKDKTTPLQNKINHYRYTYGISLDELDELHKEHDNKCAICGDNQSKLYVDHCHDTGRIRGLLCQKCNSAIGFLNDDPNLVENALKYLRKEV